MEGSLEIRVSFSPSITERAELGSEDHSRAMAERDSPGILARNRLSFRAAGQVTPPARPVLGLSHAQPPPPCRYLSHTELAPLRAPLIPMEHCTTRFFETCDLDNDKYIALDEWAGCFGIKERECARLSAGRLRARSPLSLPSVPISPLCALPGWVGFALRCPPDPSLST